MHPNRTHEVVTPDPEFQSIFTNTYPGVPNPQIPHEHPYPTRFHGPVYGVPRFGLPYRKQSWQAPSGLPGKAPTGGCIGCSGFGAEITGSVSIDASGVEAKASVNVGGGKTTTKGELAKAIIEIIEKRSGSVLDQNAKAYLTIQTVLYPKGTAAAVVVLAAYGFERNKNWARAASEWTNARSWMNVSYNSSGLSTNVWAKSGAKTVSALFARFAAEDQAGGPRRLLAVARPSSTVLDLVSSNPTPSLPPPQTKMIEIEPSMTPWLVLGGVAVVSTAGYFYWRSQKKSP